MTTTTSKASLPLPELRSGDTVITTKGKAITVRRVSKGRDTGFSEPLYKLVYPLAGGRKLVGHGVFTLDEMAAAGITIKETP